MHVKNSIDLSYQINTLTLSIGKEKVSKPLSKITLLVKIWIPLTVLMVVYEGNFIMKNGVPIWNH